MTTTPDTPHAAEPEDSGVAPAQEPAGEVSEEPAADAPESGGPDADTASGEAAEGVAAESPVAESAGAGAAEDSADGDVGQAETDEAAAGETAEAAVVAPEADAGPQADADADPVPAGPDTEEPETNEPGTSDAVDTDAVDTDDAASPDDDVRDLALFALTIAHQAAPQGPVTVTPEEPEPVDDDAPPVDDRIAAKLDSSGTPASSSAAEAVEAEDEPALFAPPTQHAAVPPPPAEPTKALPPVADVTEVLPAVRQPGSPADATEVLPPFPFPGLGPAQRQTGQAPRHPAPAPRRRPSSAIPLGPVPVRGGARGGVGQQAHDYAPEAAYAGWEPATPVDPAARRRRLALSGSVAGAAVLLTLGTIAVVNAVDPGDWSYLEGDVASAQEADAVQLVLGTCVEQLPPDGAVTGVTVVPCAEEHSAQVVGRTDFAPEAIWPGEDAARQRVSQVCGPDQLGEAARAAESSASLTYVVWTPSEQSWADGDRVGLCLASSASPSTGSLLE
ncbi:septum formation family protein [Antribacter gilvus]|uniref:septum formation family protein n=1 Tax=Antribacter gilvus TaxID=2304675 RepID=UPI000F796669|nr:septum formation family protein [Antribacter gilvus]